MPHQAGQTRSSTDILARLRALEEDQLRFQQQKLADLAMRHPPTRPTTPPPPIPQQPEQGGSFVGDVLRGIDPGLLIGLPPGTDVSGIPDLFGKTIRGIEAVEKPFAAAALTLPWEAMAPELALMGVGQGEKEQARRQRSRDILKQAVTGRTSLGEARAGLETIQRERPWLAQGGTEALTSPFNIIPIGKVVTGAKYGVKGIKTAAQLLPWTADAKRISEPFIFDTPAVGSLSSRIRDLGPIRKLLIKGITREDQTTRTVLGMPLRIPGIRHMFSDALLNDTHPVAQTLMEHQALSREWVPDVTGQTMLRMTQFGDPGKLFKLDKFGVAQADNIKSMHKDGLAFNTIAQHPENYRHILTPEQGRWIDEGVSQIEALSKHAIDMGVLPDEILGSVPGNYWPSFHKWLNGIELKIKKGIKLPDVQQSRIYDEFVEAFNRGYRGGNPVHDMELLTRSIYKGIVDKRFVDQVKPYLNTIMDRVSPQTIREAAQATKRATALGDLSRNIDMVIKWRSKPKRALKVPGSRLVGRFAPDTIEDLDKILRMPLIKDRQASLRKFRTRLKELHKQHLEHAKNAKKAEADAIKAAGPRGLLGEVQFVGNGLNGYIATPTEMAAEVYHRYPSAMLNDLATIPQVLMKELEQAVKPFAPTSATGIGAVIGAIQPAVAAVGAVGRTLTASLDLGVSQIHGVPMMVTHPLRWSANTLRSLHNLIDPEVMGRYATENLDVVRKLGDSNNLHGAGSDLIEGVSTLVRGLEEVQRIPVLGHVARPLKFTLKMAENQFNAWILGAKIEFWKAMEPAAEAAFKAGNANAYAELGESIGKMTGTVSMPMLGMKPSSSQALSAWFLFSPRYTTATLGLVADLGRGGLRGDIARQTIGSMLAGGALMYAAVAHRLGQPIYLNPTERNFMTIRAGDTQVGIGSMYVALARLAVNVGHQMFTEPTKLVRIDKRDHVLRRFMESRLSIPTRFMHNYIMGRDYMGTPTRETKGDIARQIGDSSMPFWLSGLWDNPRSQWQGVSAEVGGMRTYSTSYYWRAHELGDIDGQKRYGKNYADLNKEQRGTVLANNPEMQRLFEENSKRWGEAGNAINQFRTEMQEITDTIHEPGIEDIVGSYLHTRNGDTFRKQLHVHNAIVRHSRETLKAEHEDAVAELDKKLKERVENPDNEDYIGDIAYNDYILNVVSGDFDRIIDDDGLIREFDFGAYERAKRAIQDKYGANIYDYIQRVLSIKTNPVIQEYYTGRDREETRRYWKAADTILERSGNGHLKAEWHNYTKAHRDHQVKIEEANPIFKQIKRAQSIARGLMREQDALLDAYFIKWYGYTPKHADNIERGPEDIRNNRINYVQGT